MTFELAVVARLDLIEDLDLKSVALAGPGEEVRRAGARFAEVEVPTDDHRADAEPLDEHPFDELGGGEARERGVESQENRPVDAKAVQGARLDRERGQPEDNRAPGEEVGGVRLEGQHRAWQAALLGERAGAADHCGVTEVHAVEIADRIDRFLKSDRTIGRVDRERERGIRRSLCQSCIRAEPSRAGAREPASPAPQGQAEAAV